MSRRTMLTAGSSLLAAALLVSGCSAPGSDTDSLAAARIDSRFVSSEDSRRLMYEYFPDAQVYFANETGLWYYRLGRRWRSSPELPAEVEVDQFRRVSILLSTDKPYRVHGSVYSAYPPGSVDASSATATVGVSAEH